MKRGLIVVPLLVVACHGASEAVRDAGALIRDAGELVEDAGRWMVDAGAAAEDAGGNDARAHAQDSGGPGLLAESYTAECETTVAVGQFDGAGVKAASAILCSGAACHSAGLFDFDSDSFSVACREGDAMAVFTVWR